jgi:hypothetical protein
MTVMIVTFFNASGIDFGNFLNAHLKSKRLSTNYLILIKTTSETFAFYHDPLELAAGSLICENLLTPATFVHYYCINER